MVTIWKYGLSLCERGPDGVLSPNRIDVPRGAVFLSAREQGSHICLWALVDPRETHETREYEVYGIGSEIPDRPRRFLGTAMLDGGALVFHVFELETADTKKNFRQARTI